MSHIIRKTICELDWYNRNNFLKKVDYISFPDEKIEEYAVNTGLTRGFNLCPVIPISMWDTSFKKKNDTDKIFITIPGTIDIRRRDYKLVLEAFGKLPGLKQKTVLTLLGRPKNKPGQKLISDFTKLKNPNLEIRTFQSKVPMEDYRNMLQQTDFFILPVIISTKYTIYKELYGHTKISGSINDMITAGKPALIASDYPLNDHLQKITEPFSNTAELTSKLSDWINNQTFRSYFSKVDDALTFYRKDNMMNYLLEVLNNLKTK